MDRKSFLNRINEEDRINLSSVFDKIQFCEKSGKTAYSNEFYAPKIWKIFDEIKYEFHVNIQNYGVYEDSERRMLCFTADVADAYPIVLLKICNKSKFHKLEHKDYLGAVMSLGIKREKFGDFVVHEDVCYAAACEDVSDYVIYNLKSIGNNPCSVEIVDCNNMDVQFNFDTYVVNSTSHRIDCLVGALCNLSRSSVETLIKQGKVFLDYTAIYEKDKNVCEGSIITVRGYGKFKLIENVGSTSKGRCKILIKKYI